MWSKRPAMGGKGLRCKIHVQRDGSLTPCDWPARRYGQQVKAFWKENEILDVGTIDCCIGHSRKLWSQGVILTLIDRRRTHESQGTAAGPAPRTLHEAI